MKLTVLWLMLLCIRTIRSRNHEEWSSKDIFGDTNLYISIQLNDQLTSATCLTFQQSSNLQLLKWNPFLKSQWIIKHNNLISHNEKESNIWTDLTKLKFPLWWIPHRATYNIMTGGLTGKLIAMPLSSTKESKNFQTMNDKSKCISFAELLNDIPQWDDYIHAFALNLILHIPKPMCLLHYQFPPIIIIPPLASKHLGRRDWSFYIKSHSRKRL